jgi:hypothetical protein
MSELKDALTKALTSVTKDYTLAKRRSRTQYLSIRESQALRAGENRAEKAIIRDATYKVMAKAYKLASADGTLPANARQIMYAARPLVLALTDGKCWKKSSYFTQTLLPDYQSEQLDETADWNVVYDARGHFVEPHVRSNLGMGTLEVRQYVNSWGVATAELDIEIEELYPTKGPKNRFKYALFIEKEGFNPLLESSQIAKKYDLAIFSSKGQSTTATRELVDHLSQEGVTVLVAHDFDVSGLSIVHNLCHDTRRYTFQSDPNVIDIGLRLDDANDMGLQNEPVDFGRKQKNPSEKLRDYDDVTEEEIDFLVDGGHAGGWSGKRVELNAMTSDQFVAWLERKLKEQGVKKVIPDQETLTAAWQRADRVSRIQEAIEEIEEEIESDETSVPKNLGVKVRRLIKKKPELSWDRALVQIARRVKE